MSRNSASLPVWLGVMIYAVACAFFALWLEQNGQGDRLLAIAALLNAIVCMIWLFERL